MAAASPKGLERHLHERPGGGLGPGDRGRALGIGLTRLLPGMVGAIPGSSLQEEPFLLLGDFEPADYPVQLVGTHGQLLSLLVDLRRLQCHLLSGGYYLLSGGAALLGNSRG